MSNPSKLFQTLFQRNPNSYGSEQWLSEIAEKYPFFAAAHFYKLGATGRNDSGYSKEITRTSLFFNHNYWLNYQLGRHRISFSDSPGTSAALAENEAGGIVVSESGKLIVSEHEYDLKDTETEISEVHQISEPATDLPRESFAVNEVVASPFEPVAENSAPDAKEPDTITLDSDSGKEQGYEQESHEEVVVSQVDELTEELKSAEQIRLSSDFLEIASAEIEHTTASPGQEKEELPLFEPLHTTDYFASQGIKASEVVKPDDKLGHQLKRFTDWLKTMKRLQDVSADNESAPVDVKVEQMAEKSNKTEEVVTEAMAEILTMQGLKQKAIDIYHKLSLLNPDKSGYFAIRIEELTK